MLTLLQYFAYLNLHLKFIIQVQLYINCFPNFVCTLLMQLNNFIQTHYDICGQDSYQFPKFHRLNSFCQFKNITNSID